MIDRVTALTVTARPYATSGDHLRAELARTDLLIRAQVARWRMTIGASKPEKLWGMVHVSEAEIDQYFAAPSALFDETPEPVARALQPFLDAESQAAGAIRQAVAETPTAVDLRLERLRLAFALSDAERDIVNVCLLPEIDFRYRRIFGYLQDDASRTRPSVDLVLRIVRPHAQSLEAARALFEPGRALRAHHFVVIHDQDEGRAAAAVRLDDRVVSFLCGADEADSRLHGIVSPLASDVGWNDLLCSEAMAARLRQLAIDAAQGAVAVFCGPAGSGRRKAARALTTALGCGLLRVDVEAALRDPGRWELVVDLVYREATLADAAIYWDGVERLRQDDQPGSRWQYLIAAAERAPGLTVLASTTSADGSRLPESPLLRFDFPVPHDDLRRRIWLAYLPPASELPERDTIAGTLAAVFQLTEGQVCDAVRAATALARRRDRVAGPTADDLHEACRKQAGRRLLGFARRIEPSRRLTIDDVILGTATRRQVQELLDRVRLRGGLAREIRIEHALTRGKGLIALFAGASGTGKTLSAELLASQQGIDLYKVDLSAVVSKWVGDTEKNLERVFAEAEDSNALLFFDECDSLFGQRGRISDARDRWANLQVNYLLQRVEDYSGVVVMATNLRKNIDEAFARRIEVVIEFPSPDAELRFRIWQRILPVHALTSEELRLVAERFAFTGGNIRNVAIDATFRALAAERRAVTTRDLVASVAREYQKLGKPITQGDFGDVFYAWAVEDVLSPRTQD